MGRPANKFLTERIDIRLAPGEKDFLRYLAKLEYISSNALVRKLILSYGESKNISFWQFKRLGEATYHDQRQQMLIAQGRASDLSRELKKTKEELEKLKHGR
jgi:hypothetical protein